MKHKIPRLTAAQKEQILGGPSGAQLTPDQLFLRHLVTLYKPYVEGRKQLPHTKLKSQRLSQDPSHYLQYHTAALISQFRRDKQLWRSFIAYANGR